jgi:hypothetical protein
MAEDLPIYPDAGLRSARQFADLDRLRLAVSPVDWDETDRRLAALEGAVNVAQAREALSQPSPANLAIAHARLFQGRPGAGQWRQNVIIPAHRGQDSVPPEFVERSVTNLFGWLEADSFLELHPIEQAALAMIRLIDIWPFDLGNLTSAIIVANHFLDRARLDPFFVLPEHQKEFQTTIARGFTMDTQPLVNAIYNTVWRGMKARENR